MIIDQSRHESGYSDYCSTTTIHFYEDLNVVIRVTKYDSGKTFYHTWGGDENTAEEAKRRVEQGRN